MKKVYLLLSAIVVLCISVSNLQSQNINGYVWEDANGNGVQDGGENPLDGVLVELLDQFGVPTGITATTGATNTGEYTLTGAVSGTNYSVSFNNVTGIDGNYVATTFQAGGDATIDSDVPQGGFNSAGFTMPAVDLDDQDAGFYVVVSCGNLVWLDDNGNGIDDDGPISLPAGVAVTLEEEEPLGSGTWVTASDWQGNPLADNPITTTDAYQFDDLSPGNYRVSFADGSANAMYFTYEDYNGGTDQASDDVDDSDAKRADMLSHEFLMLTGDPLYDPVDAGYFQAYSIEGYVWEDLDGNGEDNDGSGNTPNPVDVTLQIESPIGSGTWIDATDEYNSIGTLTNPVNTDNTYSFLNLPPGNYRVLFEEPGDANPAAMHLTEANATGDGGVDIGDAATDSDPDRVAVGGNGITHEILLTNARGSFNVMNVNAGYFLPVRIGDFVWEDPNGDGDQADAIPLDIPVDISLFRMDIFGVAALDVDGVPYAVPINQDGAGIYDFFPLPPGEYQVQFDWVEPTIFATTMDAVADEGIDSDIMDCVAGGAGGTSRTPSTVFLNSDEEDLTLDAGFFKPVRISDFVWEDLNGNGIQDGNGPGIAGVQVEILEAVTLAPVDYADCTPTAGSVTTDGAGLYEFLNLRPGDYVVQFFTPSAPDQFYISPMDATGGAGQAADATDDSDADPITGLTFDITAVSDDDLEDIDCGMFRAASIGNYCWHDLNGDGLDDGSEPALAGVSIAIVNDDTGLIPIDLTTGAPVISPMTSDGGGMYLFDNIPPGNYVITFTEPGPDWFVTRADVTGANTDATDVGDDSDADPNNANMTHVIELESGERAPANGEDRIDAGFFRVASIGNLVWHDSDANGNFDDGVGALPAGVTITVVDLITGDDPALDIMGNPAVFNIPAGGISAPYFFSGVNGLKPGTYDVRLDVPGGWFVTDLGGQNIFDPATGTISTGPIMLISDQINNDLDGGIYANITVGGNVFGDADDDCLYAIGTETGYPGVIVSLINDIGDTQATTASDAMGNYMFMDVKPGDYTMEIQGPNFDPTAVLYQLIPCGPGNDPNDDVPLDNNGDGPQGGPVVTTVIELRCGGEPAGGGLENKTIDFGFKFDCAAENNPFAYFSCQEAADNPICNVLELEQGCGTMPNMANPQGPSPLCPGGGGVPHNLSWFSFIAGYGDYDIEIALSGCLPGPGGNTSGIQSGLYLYDPDNADCWGSDSPYCEDGCSGGNIILDGAGLIPGQQYLMFLDGCNGSYCGYDINILGNYIPFIVNEATAVNCDGQADCDLICPGTTITFDAQDDLQTYGDVANLLFSWSLRDADGITIIDDYLVNGNEDYQTTENEITIDFNAVGTYFLCLDQIADICDNVVFADICQEITVITLEDEDFGVIEICTNELLFYQGPTSVNDEDIIFDPNMDGTDGWQAPIPTPGDNEFLITTSIGCTYTQEVFIVELFNSEVGLIDTAICGGSNFGFEMFDNTINSEAQGLFYTETGQAANGCDTSFTLNAWNLEIDGEIENLGCSACGFSLAFDQSLFANTPNATVVYEWLDALGDPVPDDGDGDPLTTCVPTPGDYTFMVTFTYNSESSFLDIPCPYEFDINVSGDNLLPETPTADNWQNQFCEYDSEFVYVAETTDDPNDITFLWTYPTDVASAMGETTDSLTIDWTGSIGGEVCVTITNVCGTSEPVCDTIVIVPTPVAAIAPLDSICVDSLASIEYPGPQDPTFAYAWNFDTGNPVGGTNVAGPIDVSWGSAGIKNISLTITKSGCISSAVTTPILVVEPVEPPLITCTATLDEVVFTWDDPSGSTGYIPSITTSQTGGVLAGNTYTVGGLIVGEVVDITLITNTTSPCGDLISTGTCTAQNCPPNTVTISPIAPICVDANTAVFDLIDFASLENAINGDYMFTGTAITDAAQGTFDPKLAMEGPNVVPVVFTDDFDCVYNTSVTIRVNPIPTSTFEATPLICQDSSALVEYTGSILTGGVFNWDADDVINPLNGAGPFPDVMWSTPGNKTISLDVSRSNCPSDVTMIPVVVEPRIEPIDIECDGDATSIDISWDALDNVTDYSITVTYPDLTTETFDLTGNGQNISGLTPGSSIFIELSAESDNSCPGVMDTMTCIAVNCPPTTITLTNDTTLCLDATAVPFQLSAEIEGGLGAAGMGMGTWSGTGVDPNTGIFDPQAAGVSPPGGHVITYTYTELTCVNDKRVRISLINQPTSDISAPDVICVTDALLVSYDGSAPNLPFDWTVAGGGVVTPAGGNNYSIQWSDAGTYDISLRVGQGTCLSDLSTISAQVDPENSPVDIECTTTLNSITFTWDDIDCASEYQILADNVDLGINTSLTYTATGLSEGTMVEFQVIPNEECACPSIPASLTCTAKACPSVVLTLSTPIESFCEGSVSNIINLQVDVQGSENPGTGTWSGDGGVTPDGQFNPAGVGPGVYTFTYSYNETNCDFDESISIEVFANPSVEALATDPTCYQDNFGSVVINPSGGTGSNYTVLVDNETKTDDELKAVDPGSYTVMIADGNGCEAETTFTIQDAIAAQLELNGNTIIKAGDEGTLMADVTSIDGVLDSIVWYNSDGDVLCSGLDCTSLVISPDPQADEVEYCAVMFYNDGCTVEECITIRVRRTDVIILPNVLFTASGSGNGEFYIPEYETIMQVKSMLIYDRWGNKMFDIRNAPKGQGNGWKGKFNNQDVTPGVYVYTVELDMENGDVLKLSGDVTVL